MPALPLKTPELIAPPSSRMEYVSKDRRKKKRGEEEERRGEERGEYTAACCPHHHQTSSTAQQSSTAKHRNEMKQNKTKRTDERGDSRCEDEDVDKLCKSKKEKEVSRELRCD